jgi:hypothetical protein
VTPAPAAELRYVVYPWVIDWAALRAVGWRPLFSNTGALPVLLADRANHHAVVGRFARKDAAITAAGAAGTAAAVIGTAAIVRRARKKSKG